MKYIKSFLVLAIAVLGFSVFNAKAQEFKNVSYNVPAAAAAAADPAIEKKVSKEINKLVYYGVFDNIGYKVEGNTVTLSGKVVMSITKKEAASNIQRIEGVGNVINNIEILPLSSLDNSIRYNTLQTLNATGGLSRYLWEPNPSVRIIVDRGILTLEGRVANRGDYNLMHVKANGISGVFSVINNLVIDKEANR